MIKIKTLIHEKEKTYLLIMKILGIILWLILLFASMGTILIWGAFIAFGLWISGLYFKAVIYGDSVKVSPSQFPEIYDIIIEQSNKLNLTNIPEVFIYNGSGLVNAFAVKFLSAKYVILMSDLVDLSLKRGKIKELSMIIGHELGHHAAGHTSFLKGLLIKPANFVPFLGSAYSRACEFTADRIGFTLTEDLSASENALVALALGSESLANDTNIEAFILQEKEIPDFMGFIHKIYSTHPRMTKRVIEIRKFNKLYLNK
ncbi:M48 family metallopeptidase [Tenacibaculum finnmarkense]|uniref:M48 family metallopeptidase n=1 Tax=Tenacibaculum finnmarkense TaxID=2781243 RepID=UPI001E5834C1|nr:M48 family metallopeptidase [Tenacibaculum finnmarkense]MCD8445693.1 M48 family metallopeptidase [Tenacibaculum finnmarkense genomovar ulcerans]